MFRKETSRAAPVTTIGEVLLVQPLSAKIITWLIVVTTLAFLVFLSFVNYSKTMAVGGEILVADGTEVSPTTAALTVPASAMGSIEAGEILPVRMAAFPASDTPPLAATITGWSETPTAGITSDDVKYEVYLALGTGTFQSGDKALQLVPGMKVSSRIVLETRSLLQWIAPSFSFGGRD